MVADIAVDLAGELLIAQAQGHHVGGDVVQQLRCGPTSQVLRVDGEPRYHCKEGREQLRTKQRPRYLVGGPGWSGAGPVAVGTGVLPLSVDDPGGESHPQQPDAGDR